MYANNKTNRVTLRLTDEQFLFVKENADVLGVSPSEFLRMVINAAIASKKGLLKINREGLGRENDKTNIDNIV